ncbi:hypothetical protein K0504_16625 [Neiella marina]|uniref:Uncharacterized protein n=1 Tax=Neiella holothuriorum TaxID=2870530 RepID=A0ABS7EKB0_9GAMM|nr:hypothetical protein [Neiella holothuriorum]MBW8192665.1 hypothetical protein [Neiella holothuriorum]
MSPEFIILLLNGVLLVVAYFWLYPSFVSSDLKRLLINDVLASGVAIVIAGVLFYGKGVVFNAVLFEANWFWFTLLSYFVLEIPFSVVYCNKYDLWRKF